MKGQALGPGKYRKDMGCEKLMKKKLCKKISFLFVLLDIYFLVLCGPHPRPTPHLSAHHLLLCGNMQITFPEPLTSVSGSGSRTLPSIHVNRYFTKLIQLLKNVANEALPK
jgi:hypothetical protein